MRAFINTIKCFLMRSKRTYAVVKRVVTVYKLSCRKLMVWAILSIPSTARNRVAHLFRYQYQIVAQLLDAIPDTLLEKTVLFISIQPHSREARLAAAARIAGWNPILVYTGLIWNDADENFSSHGRVRNIFHLALVSWYYRGPIVHVFALSGYEAYPFCASKTRPVILDLYDTISGMTWVPRHKKRAEQRAIQHADAMTHRDLRVKYLHDLHDYVLPRHNVLIHDPITDFEPIVVRDRRDREIHVASTGWVSDGDNSILRTAAALCEAGVHIHVVCNPLQTNAMSEVWNYGNLDERSKYFHIEQPMRGDAYWEFLARCDFGLAIFEPHLFSEPATSYTEDYLQGCGSSRLMDYIRMSLGVIVSPSLKFQNRLARRYAPVVVPATNEFLRDPKTKLMSALKERDRVVAKNVAAITAHGVASRLDKFYAEVAVRTGGDIR